MSRWTPPATATTPPSASTTPARQDTLLAEAGDYASLIERFRDGKAEHNAASLAVTLEVAEDAAVAAAKPLIDLGFLEQTGETFKVPMLYRDGLNITQGKAFEPDASSGEGLGRPAAVD